MIMTQSPSKRLAGLLILTLRARWNRIEAVAAIVLLVAGLAVAPADAQPRALNGQISFGRFDPKVDGFVMWKANPDGSHQQRLTTTPGLFADWAPNGQRIAFDFFTDQGEQHIATIRADGRRTRQLTFGSGIQEVPKWSPDGRSITYNAAPVTPEDPAFTTSIWVIRADGTRQRRLTSGGFDVEPVFSPDGAKIAFARLFFNTEEDYGAALYVMNRDGTGLRQVVPPRVGLEHPDWSPDGRWITFNIAPELPHAADSGSILGVAPSGGRPQVLHPATAEFVFFKPVWSPDGRKLLVGCFDTRAESICVVDRHRGSVRVVVAGSPERPVNFPAWGTHPPQGTNRN